MGPVLDSATTGAMRLPRHARLARQSVVVYYNEFVNIDDGSPLSYSGPFPDPGLALVKVGEHASALAFADDLGIGVRAGARNTFDVFTSFGSVTS